MSKLIIEINRIHQLMGIKKNINEGPFVSKTFYEAEEQTLKKRWKEAYKAIKDQFDLGYLTKAEAEQKVSNLVDQLVGITDDTERASLRQSKIAKLGSVIDDSADILDSITIKIEKVGNEYAEKLKTIDNTWSELEGLIDDNMLKVWDSPMDDQGIQGLKQNLDDMVKDCKNTETPLKDAYLEMYPTKSDYFTEWERYIDEIVDTTHPIPKGIGAEDQLRYKKLNDLRKQFLKNRLNDYKDLDFIWNESKNIKKTLNDLNPKVKEKYNKILEKEKNGIKLSERDTKLKSDVERFFDGENIILKDYEFTYTLIEDANKLIAKFITKNPIKNEFSQLIRDIIYSLDNTTYIPSTIENTFPQFKNGIIPESLKKTITDDPNLKNFFTNLENKKYGWQVDSEGKWIPTNMLDGNTGDKTTFFRDVLETIMENDGKKISDFIILSKEEQDKLLLETLEYIKNNKNTLKNKLLESERYIKNSQRTIIRGDEGEEIAKNAFIKNNFEIVWQGGKGNALDKLGVDMIVKKDGKHYLVSVKTIPGEFRTYPSKMTGKNLIGFLQPSKINIDTGFAAYVDKNNKLIVVPPQARFSKETGEKIGEGFRKDLGWTQIEDDSVIIKNF